MSKVRVHKITLAVIDFERAPDSEVAYALGNQRHFPGTVMAHEVAETEWDGDDHPLNQGDLTPKQFDAWMKANGAVLVRGENP